MTYKILIEKLKPHKNSRPISEGHITSLMWTDAVHKPIIINSDLEVVEGVHRLEALKRMGMLVVDIILVKEDWVEQPIKQVVLPPIW